MNEQESIISVMDNSQNNRMSREFSGSSPSQKKIPKPHKPTPSEQYGFNVSKISRVYKSRSICESPRALFKAFSKAVKEKYPDAHFPSEERIGADIGESQEVLQLLHENECLNEETLYAWIDWYVSSLSEKHPCRKFVHIMGLRETWNRFRKFRPKLENVVRSSVVVKEQDVGWIVDKMDEIFKEGFSKDKVVRACKLFGIVLTSQYMLRVLGSKQVAEALMASSLNEACSDKDTTKSIYNASSLYGVGRAASNTTFMNDWKTKYETLWNAAFCSRRLPDPSREEIVAEFFRRMEKNESKV